MITITDLHKRFRKTEAVAGLSLQVPEGQVTAFLGPNGAGKSTTIKCLLNLHRPDSGSAISSWAVIHASSAPHSSRRSATFRRTWSCRCG
jgi:ABC-2 type transport system ATP-binding protein